MCRLGWPAVAACVLVLVVAVGPAPAADWPQWRGPDHNGVSRESSGFPAGWPPKRLWGRNVGVGCTSPILAAGRLYVMGWHGRGRGNPRGADTVFCLDARTGRELWKQSYPCRYQGRLRTGDTGAYGGPSSTPTFDAAGGRLYTLSVDGDLRCWNAAAKGKLVWEKNLYDRYQVARRPDAGKGQRDFGYTGSPLVLGDAVIVEVGSGQGTVMAFDKATGRRRWSSALKGPAGHTAGPVPMTVAGLPCLATLTLTELVVLRIDPAQVGGTIARHRRQTDYACSLATPAVVGDRLLLTSGYNNKSTELLDVSTRAARKRWTSPHHALLSTPVVHKQRAYLVHRALHCLDLSTGRLKWRGGSFEHGSCLVTAADDKAIVFGRGRLVLVAASGKEQKYRELARVDRIVPKTCYPHVALSDGILCCKDRAGNLVCFSVR